MTRNYRVTVYSNGKKMLSETYENLMEAVLFTCKILDSMNILYCIDNGRFIESEFLRTKKYKLFRIENTIPECRIDIKKMSTGNLDADTLKLYIVMGKGLYEGNKDRFRE